MTFEYKNVYILDSSCVVGPFEDKGSFSEYYDRKYNDLYFGEKSWEQAEIKMLKESINILLLKCGFNIKNVNLMISGDLLNQIVSSNYVASKFCIPYLGIYSACSTITEGIIIGSSMIDSGKINNCIVCTSSHNMSSEKQFRNPTEYGAPKKKTSTFTATGGVSIMLTNKKTNIKITSSTIGTVINKNQKDSSNMGAAMACAAADTIYKHLINLNKTVDNYDLILTGDLGLCGKNIFKEYFENEYNIKLGDNYKDCGVMLYNLKNQKNVNCGGSGPACCALVTFGYVLNQMRNGKYKKVLLAATGALFSPTILFQKQCIPSISHVITLEVVE